MSQQNDQPGNLFGLQAKAGGEPHVVSESMSVGRDPSSDLVLSSGKASRRHARVYVEEGALWVEDLNSTNGTYVNGQKIKGKSVLQDGDSVRFGDLAFTAIAPKPPEQSADATILASGETILQGASASSDEKRVKADAASGPAEDKSASEAPPASAKKKTAKKAAKKKPSGEDKATPETELKDEEEPAPKKEPPAVAEPHKSDPSIPASWADAEELEQASHTAFVSRAPGAEGESGATSPLRAIAQARREVPPEEPILVGLTDPIKNKVIRLHRKHDVDKWEMGRNESADIVIDNESVSGRHAQLVCEGGRWKVVNMMSVNGTFVNGRKVLSAYLNPRDQIRMGTVELVFDGPVAKPKRRRKAQPKKAASDSGLSTRLRNGMNWLMSKFRRGS